MLKGAGEEDLVHTYWMPLPTSGQFYLLAYDRWTIIFSPLVMLRGMLPKGSHPRASPLQKGSGLLLTIKPSILHCLHDQVRPLRNGTQATWNEQFPMIRMDLDLDSCAETGMSRSHSPVETPVCLAGMMGR